jgi:hypothetical protein
MQCIGRKGAKGAAETPPGDNYLSRAAARPARRPRDDGPSRRDGRHSRPARLIAASQVETGTRCGGPAPPRPVS